MCGIVGIVNFGAPFSEKFLSDSLTSMADKLIHRGPDSSDYWFDINLQAGLAHRRLAIQDTTSNGSQPMFSSSKRYVVVFNGEIYNHFEIRRELDTYISNITWNSNSDTETLLTAIEFWGLDIAINKFVGMFSFALLDNKQKTITLARDRFGEKPLYFGIFNNSLVFSSELKSLKSFSFFKSSINVDALKSFLLYSYVPGNQCIYDNVKKLHPGTLATIHLNSSESEKITYKSFWNASSVALSSLSCPYNYSYESALNSLEHLLIQSISGQLVSDVPLGAFLSGGIDSSLIVSLMQELSTSPVKTFTIGFDNSFLNEAKFASSLSNHFGTDHHELYIDPNDALYVIPKLPEIFCEPFADSSQIPTFLVSKLASNSVTVCLSGDGGDELFAGYNRYIGANKYWNIINRTPNILRKNIFKIGTSVKAKKYDELYSYFHNLLPSKNKHSLFGDKVYKSLNALSSTSPNELYNILTRTYLPHNLINSDFLYQGEWIDFEDIEHSMMLADTKSYLVDDILTKVDRASMACSLETRVPFLDHRVYEFSWSLPLKYKLDNGNGKRILKDLLYKRVPRSLVDRPKSGFAVPLGDWLRGPLREWAENLLERSTIINDGFFNVDIVHNLWEEHLKSNSNNHQLLWNILMFQSWLRSQNA